MGNLLIEIDDELMQFKANLAYYRGKMGRDAVRALEQGGLLDALDAGRECYHPGVSECQACISLCQAITSKGPCRSRVCHESATLCHSHWRAL